MNKHPAYDEVSIIPEVRSESVPQYKAAYLKAFNRETTLTDDEIVNIIASDDDGPNDDAWYTSEMLKAENEKASAAA